MTSAMMHRLDLWARNLMPFAVTLLMLMKTHLKVQVLSQCLKFGLHLETTVIELVVKVLNLELIQLKIIWELEKRQAYLYFIYI